VLALVLLAVWVGSGVPALAGHPPPAPALTHEHRHPTAGFVFRTPEDWTVAEMAGRPGAIEAGSGALRVRFIWHQGDEGFDAAHTLCTLERLTPAMETEPQMSYEYEFISGTAGNRRFLDSAFGIRYDKPVMGQREWRQRALTIVGDDGSLCMVSAAPSSAWKKHETRAVLDGILASLTFPRVPAAGP
jgi:hypothetical protein